MNNKLTYRDLECFYDQYEKQNPILVLVKIILTLGIYIFVWIYNMNLKLEKVDEDTPESSRGAIILVLIPIFLLFINFMLINLLKLSKSIIATTNVLLWSCFIFLSLKYIYDFCLYFGKWTSSNGLIWYLSIYPGYFSIVLLFFEFYYTIPLLFFTIITIPAMQAFLNIKERKFREIREHETFNRTVKAE